MRDSFFAIVYMYRVILVAISILLVSVGYAANLKVDATKRKNPRIIQPEMQKAKIVSGIQNKRFATKKFNKGTLVYRDARFPVSSRQPNETMSQFDGKKASIVDSESKRTSKILDQVVTSSDVFEKAYRNALKVELSKLAAAQVEVKKPKAKVNQGDINKDAQVRRSARKGFEVQKAGSKGK